MNLEAYLQDLRIRGRSSATITTYRRDLEHFAAFLKKNKLRVTQVKPRTILDYLRVTSAAAIPKTPSTMRRLAALSSFFRYLQVTSNGRISNPVAIVPRPKSQSPNPKPADPVDLEALITGLKTARDRAIVSLFRCSGLRLSELASVNRRDIQVEEMEAAPGVRRVLGIGRVMGKGGREREFFVDEPTLRLLGAYLKQRGHDGLEPLFLSNQKRRMTPRMIEMMLANACRRMGLSRIHPHSIRHAFATHLHASGVGTLEISHVLGHSHIGITHRFLRDLCGTFTACNCRSSAWARKN